MVRSCSDCRRPVTSMRSGVPGLEALAVRVKLALEGIFQESIVARQTERKHQHEGSGTSWRHDL